MHPIGQKLDMYRQCVKDVGRRNIGVASIILKLLVVNCSWTCDKEERQLLVLWILPTGDRIFDQWWPFFSPVVQLDLKQECFQLVSLVALLYNAFYAVTQFSFHPTSQSYVIYDISDALVELPELNRSPMGEKSDNQFIKTFIARSLNRKFTLRWPLGVSGCGK